MEEVSGHRHGQQDQENREGKNGAKVGPEVPPRCVNGRGIDERRQKQIEDELGIEPNRGKTRNERQESARDREQNWIRNADFPGDERKQRDGHETNQN